MLLFIFSLVMSACSEQSQVNPHVEIDGYEESEINEDIPVPADAEVSEVEFSNPNIKEGKKYTLENIGGEQGLYPPLNYFDEMKNWGWEELKDERKGHVHFFRKEDQIISIEISEDYVNLYEMEEGFEF
ncbi:hypothetical protein ACFOZY_00350 [Chungangia koreensis]|uniref:Lipoprotein n=1 Tax=Chungangia koreensis TaxID=752657 RepID=A0ABV8X192_9LACT